MYLLLSEFAIAVGGTFSLTVLYGFVRHVVRYRSEK